MDTLSCSVAGTLPDPASASGRVPPQAPVWQRAECDRRRSTIAASASPAGESDESTFLELRRKVQAGELLSAATEKLLRKMRFNGHLTVVIQHGTVVKSGYEEGYFRRRNDLGAAVLKT